MFFIKSNYVAVPGSRSTSVFRRLVVILLTQVYIVFSMLVAAVDTELETLRIPICMVHANQ
jgi:hypothetical protein